MLYSVISGLGPMACVLMWAHTYMTGSAKPDTIVHFSNCNILSIYNLQYIKYL